MVFRPEDRLILRLDSLTLEEAAQLVKRLKGRTHQFLVHDLLQKSDPGEVVQRLKSAGADIVIADMDGVNPGTLLKVMHAGANLVIVGSRVAKAIRREKAVEEIIGEIAQSFTEPEE